MTTMTMTSAAAEEWRAKRRRRREERGSDAKSDEESDPFSAFDLKSGRGSSSTGVTTEPMSCHNAMMLGRASASAAAPFRIRS